MSDLFGMGATAVLDDLADELAGEVPDEPVPGEALKPADLRPAFDCDQCDYKGRSLTGLKIHKGRNHRGTKPEGETKTTPREKSPAKPEPQTRRKSGAELLSLLAGATGSLMSTTGIPSRASGVAISLEAPLIGPAADKAIAGTLVDKVALQPALKVKSRFDEIGPLLLFPVLVGICDKNPLMRAQLYPALRICVAPMLPQLVAQLRKTSNEQEKLSKAAADLSEIDPAFAQIFADGGDPIDALLMAIFPASEGMESHEMADDAA